MKKLHICLNFVSHFTFSKNFIRRTKNVTKTPLAVAMLQFCISLYLSENNPFYFIPPIYIEVLPLFIMLIQKVDIEADQKAKTYQAACIFLVM